MFRKHIFLILAVIVVGAMVVAGAVKLGLDGAGKSQAQGGPPGAAGPGGTGGPGGPGGGGRRNVLVTATTPQEETFTDRIEVLGAAKAQQSVTLTAPAQQLIAKINFQSGERVREGQVLAELNNREQDAAVVQAQSAVTLAKSNWDRWQELADRGVAPVATAEQYKANYDQAVATLQAARARVADRVIRAPFAGTIGLSDVAPGMLVNAGTSIATLDDLSVIRVDFPVPERFIPVLREGLPISATADAYPATTFQGRIAKVDTRVDPSTRSVTARAEFPNTDRRLKPGMLLHVTIDRAVRQSLAIPEAAVIFENGEAYVLSLQPAPRNQNAAGGQGGQGGQNGGQGGGPSIVAVRKTITAGLRQNGWVEVMAGLKPDERIVADGTNRVRPGDPVQIAGAGPRRGANGTPPGRAPQAAPKAAPQNGQKPAAAPDEPMTTFRSADANGDGSVSEAEWTTLGRQPRLFTRLDTDGNGLLSRSEMQAITTARNAGRPNS